MNGHLLPSDANWTQDKVLIADLSHLNAAVTRYVLRQLDADAGRAEPISADDENSLGLKLAELGERLQRRAALRESQTDAPVLNRDKDQALAPDRKPDMDNLNI